VRPSHCSINARARSRPTATQNVALVHDAPNRLSAAEWFGLATTAQSRPSHCSIKVRDVRGACGVSGDTP